MKISKGMLEQLTKDLTDSGKLIEAGWTGYRHMVCPQDASSVQLAETRTAFFAGAQHVWSSIFTVLDEGSEPTTNDLARMDQINQELERFRKELELRVTPAQGSS